MSGMSQSLPCNTVRRVAQRNRAFSPKKGSPVVPLFALLLGLLSGCAPMESYPDAAGPRYSGDHRPVAPVAVAAPSSVTVVTFNLAFAEHVTEAITALSRPPLAQADVITMQEMDAPSVERIARELGLAYVYYPASVAKDGDDFGNAVLSRWPITADAKINLPHDDPYHQQHRIAVAATLDIQGTPLQVVSVHGATPIVGLGARLEQAETVLHAVEGAAPLQVIAGDFNTSDPGSLTQTVKLFTDAGFQWASEGVGDTVDSIIGGLPLDSVFVRGLSPVERGVDPLPAGSDHQPVWVRFAWP